MCKVGTDRGFSSKFSMKFCESKNPYDKEHMWVWTSKNKPMDFKRINHSVRDGFEQNYSVVITLLQSDTYQEMMRKIWRTTYQRMRDKFFQVMPWDERKRRNRIYDFYGNRRKQ